MGELFLKLLDADMQSCNGGHQKWKLNKWYRVKGEIVICKSGLHLTLAPGSWTGQRFFIAETPKIYDKQEDKIVCRKARLLRELNREQWEAYEKARAQALEAYKKARAPAWEAYEKARAPALEAYKKAEAPALEAYKKARAPAWEAYKKAEAQALEAYKKARAPALEAYKKAEAPAWEAYEKQCQDVLQQFLRE